MGRNRARLLDFHQNREEERGLLPNREQEEGEDTVSWLLTQAEAS